MLRVGETRYNVTAAIIVPSSLLSDGLIKQERTRHQDFCLRVILPFSSRVVSKIVVVE